MAPGENEFDTPELRGKLRKKFCCTPSILIHFSFPSDVFITKQALESGKL